MGMSERAFLLLSLLFVGGVISSEPVAGQWWVDAAVGGASHEAVTAHVDTNSALVGLRREGSTWMQIAGGVPLGADGARWGSFAGGAEMMRPGRVDFGVLVGGQGYAFASESMRTDGWGALGEIGPTLRYSTSRLAVELRSGGIASWSVVEGISDARFLMSSAAEVGVAISPSVTMEAAAQYVVAEEGGYPFIGGTLAQALARGGWWARLGYWSSAQVERPEWSLGAYANAGQRMQLHAVIRQETEDPIYQRLPRRSWSLGLSYVIGKSRDSLPLSPVTVLGGSVTVNIPAGDDVSPPFLAGDFNSWTPVQMTRVGEFWTITLPMGPGVYRYSFKDGDGNWFLPPTVTSRVDDGFGGENGILVVL